MRGRKAAEQPLVNVRNGFVAYLARNEFVNTLGGAIRFKKCRMSLGKMPTSCLDGENCDPYPWKGTHQHVPNCSHRACVQFFGMARN
jgi:hypothetical protein